MHIVIKDASIMTELTFMYKVQFPCFKLLPIFYISMNFLLVPSLKMKIRGRQNILHVGFQFDNGKIASLLKT